MSLGSVTSLGVGSGFELQDMMDNFREVDEAPINGKKEEKTRIEEQIVEYDAIKTKLLAMKSNSLSLSLRSNYYERQVTISDDTIVSATPVAGAAEGNNNIEVKQLASRSSWQSDGFASSTDLVYTNPTTNIPNESSQAVSSDQTITIEYANGGTPKTFDVLLTSGSSLTEVAEAINNSTENKNGSSTYVNASVVEGDNGYYVRLHSNSSDTLTNNQIIVNNKPDFISPDLSFSYNLGTGTDNRYIEISAGMNYTDLAEAINNDEDNTGITATVIDDGSESDQYKFTLTANSTGEDSRVTIDGLNMTEVQGANGESLNATLTANGIEYQRQNNSDIKDVIQGASLNLLKEGSTSVNITPETESIKTYITDFVEAYNEVVQEISKNTTYDSTNDEEGLLSSSSVKNLETELSSQLSTIINTGGDITSMYDFGLDINKDGTISINETTLDSKIQSNFDDVVTFFAGDTSTNVTGFGTILNDALRDITSRTGILETEKTSARDRIERLDSSIESSTERLDKKYETLAEDFVRLDMYIGTLNSQSSYLNSIFDSFNSTFKKDQ